MLDTSILQHWKFWYALFEFEYAFTIFPRIRAKCHVLCSHRNTLSILVNCFIDGIRKNV